MNTLTAVALCLASSVAYTAGALLQRRIAHQSVVSAVRDQRWWWAALLTTGGAGLHVAALRFGPLLLVQPFGLLTLVLAVVAVAVGQGRRVTSDEWRGVVLTCAGLAGLLSLIDTGATDTIAAPQLPLLIGGTAAVLLALQAVGRRPGASNLWFAAAAGVTFGVTSALSQTLTVGVTTTGLAVLVSSSTLLALGALVLLVAAGVAFTQISYRRRFSAALATSTLVNPVVAALIGTVLLGESLVGGPLGVLAGIGCAAMAIVGIATLAPSAVPEPRTPNVTAQQEA